MTIAIIASIHRNAEDEYPFLLEHQKLDLSVRESVIAFSKEVRKWPCEKDVFEFVCDVVGTLKHKKPSRIIRNALAQFLWNYSEKVEDENHIQKIVKRIKRLRPSTLRICLRNLSKNTLHSICTLPEVKWKLTFVGDDWKDDTVNKALLNFKKISKISFFQCPIEYFCIPTLNKFEISHLSIVDCKKITDIVFAALSVSKSLKKLTFHQVDITSEGIMELIPNETLRKLDLRQCPLIKCEHYEQIKAAFASMEEIKLSYPRL